MLKIKAEKMKDLEKFGYKKIEMYIGGHSFEVYHKNLFRSFGRFVDVYVYKTSRLLEIEISFSSENELTLCKEIDFIYDLIKADMVEKVVEDENHNN